MSNRAFSNMGVIPLSTEEPSPGRQLLTPDVAEKWLLRTNTRNRKVKRVKLNFLIQEIESGKWRYNGQTITFTTNGALYDGQHRCWACIKTGTPIEVNVETNVEPSLDGENTANNVSPNTTSDILCMTRGVVKYGTHVASALRWSDLLESDTENSGEKYKVFMRDIKKSELPKLYDKRPQIERSVAMIMGSKKLKRMCRPVGLFAAMHYLFSIESSHGASELFAVLEHGQAPETHPAWHMREWLIMNPKSSPRDIVARFVRTWLAMRQGADMSMLRGYDKQIPNVWYKNKILRNTEVSCG